MRRRMVGTVLFLVLPAGAAVVACERPADAPVGAGADPAQQTTTPPAPEFTTSALTAGLALPFSEAARVGDLLFLSGMIGVRPGTLELVPGGIEAEARQALENIDRVLGAAGATRQNVLKCTVMLDDMSEWSRFNAIYVEFFGDHRPARSAFGTDGLALGAAVEVECIASAPARAGT